MRRSPRAATPRGFGHDGYGVATPRARWSTRYSSNGARLYVDHAHPEYSGTRVLRPARSRPLRQGGRESCIERPRHRRPVAAGQADLALQEQLGRQGQLLRRPRELPAFPGDPIRRRDPIRHHLPRHAADLHRRRKGRARRTAVPTSASSSPSGPTSSRKRSVSRRRSSVRSSTPVTSRTETRRKYRRLHVIIGDANLSETQIFLKLGTPRLCCSRPWRTGPCPTRSTWPRSRRIVLAGEPRHRLRQRPSQLEGGWTRPPPWSCNGAITNGSRNTSRLSFPTTRFAQQVIHAWEPILTDLASDPARTRRPPRLGAKHRLFRDMSIAMVSPGTITS